MARCAYNGLLKLVAYGSQPVYLNGEKIIQFYHGIEYACTHNHIDVLQWIYENKGESYILIPYGTIISEGSALEWLKSKNIKQFI